MIRTFDQLVAAFGGTVSLAVAIGVRHNSVSNWRRRRIPAAQWCAIMDAAAVQGISGVTYDTLRHLSYPEIRDQVAA